MMSVMGVKPGEMGNSIMLTRLEKSSAPVTVYIDTSKQKVKVFSRLLIYFLPLKQIHSQLMQNENVN